MERYLCVCVYVLIYRGEEEVRDYRRCAYNKIEYTIICIKVLKFIIDQMRDGKVPQPGFGGYL